MEDHRDQAHDLPRREPGLVISLPSLDAIFTHRKADNGPDSSIAEVASSSQPVVAAILEALLHSSQSLKQQRASKGPWCLYPHNSWPRRSSSPPCGSLPGSSTEPLTLPAPDPSQTQLRGRSRLLTGGGRSEVLITQDVAALP